MSDDQVVDFAAFMDETGLDDESLKELYIELLEEIDEESKKLLPLLSEGNFTLLGRVVHNIKGISGSYRLQFVYRQAVELNARMKENKLEGIEAEAERLGILIEEAVVEIRHHFEI